MDKYRITFETWNKVADLYEDKFMDLSIYDDTYDAFCKLIQKQNAKILEVGCGPGNITKYLISKRPDFSILGIDVAPRMIELAIKNNQTAVFKAMDVRNMEDLDDKFDGIVCGFCVPYLSKEDVSKLVMDAKKLLGKSGIVYLSFVEGDYNNSGYQSGSSGDKAYFYYHGMEHLSKVLKENDFEMINIFHKEYERKSQVEIHTVLIARKL